MQMFSKEHISYVRKLKKEKRTILLLQIAIIVCFILIWQILSSFKIINTFLFSSPIDVLKCLVNLYKKNELINHILITIYETIISFLLSNIIGLVVGSFLWSNKKASKVFDPYLTIINSLPKVALGPLIIIWVGASTKSIICMALMISSIISIINIYVAFNSIDENYITLLRSLNSSKYQIFKKLILPGSIPSIINNCKINISMSLIGVIMGELLVSKKGLGYLIMYGSQVFNITLVITSVFVLGIISYIMYYGICIIEKKLTR